MGIFDGIKWLWRTTKAVIGLSFRLSCFAILLSLPVTFFPITSGLIGAITQHFWLHDQIVQHTNSFLLESEMDSFQNYFDMPQSGLSIHDFQSQKGPFHIPRIRTLNWMASLGITQPRELNAAVDPNLPLSDMANLRSIVRDESHATDFIKAGSTWIYVTSLPEIMPSHWDEAFDQVLMELSYQGGYLPGGAEVVYLDCASSGFLCGAWHVKAPSLIHFEVQNMTLASRRRELCNRRLRGEEFDVEDEWFVENYELGYSYESSERRLYPVKVKVIELPLTYEYATSLVPRSTLPTPLLQLRALLQDEDPEGLLSHWSAYSMIEQLMHRFQEHIDHLTERPGTWRYRLWKADSWYDDHILEPILGKDIVGPGGFLNEVQNIVFSVLMIVLELARLPFRMCWEIYAWYFGLGWDGEPQVERDMPDLSGRGNNFMDDMFLGFMDVARASLQEQASRSAAEAGVTSLPQQKENLEKIMSMLSEVPAKVRAASHDLTHDDEDTTEKPPRDNNLFK